MYTDIIHSMYVLDIHYTHTYVLYTFKGSFWRTFMQKIPSNRTDTTKATNKYLYIVTQNKSIAASPLRHRIDIRKPSRFSPTIEC